MGPCVQPSSKESCGNSPDGTAMKEGSLHSCGNPQKPSPPVHGRQAPWIPSCTSQLAFAKESHEGTSSSVCVVSWRHASRLKGSHVSVKSSGTLQDCLFHALKVNLSKHIIN